MSDQPKPQGFSLPPGLPVNAVFDGVKRAMRILGLKEKELLAGREFFDELQNAGVHIAASPKLANAQLNYFQARFRTVKAETEL